MQTRLRAMRWLATVLVVGTTLTAAPGPASADTPNCVTRAEWRKVYIVPDGTGSGPGDGGTKRRVHGIFDITGTRVVYDQPDPTFRYQVRRYKKCARPSRYRVTYHQYKVNGAWTAWWSYWG